MAEKLDINESNTIVNNDTAKVSMGKGKVGAYFLSAPNGTSLPTDASTALDAAFNNTGFVSEDGITQALSTDTTEIKDLNGDVVKKLITSRSETLKLKFIEINEFSLKERYGQSNVQVDTATSGVIKYSVKSNSTPMPMRSYVFEGVLDNGGKLRMVVPKGQISEFGDTIYSASEVIGYEITIQCTPDENGNTFYGYIEQPTSA